VPQDTKASLSVQNLLLSGAFLKVSPAVYGCAVYTGCNSKISRQRICLLTLEI
jgi:hypothetical protein